MAEDNGYSTSIKICVMGQAVGKSCFIQRFLTQSYDGQHVKHNKMERIHHTRLNVLDRPFDLQILDTTSNHKEDITNDASLLHIELDNYSMHIRKQWLTDSNILFLLFNRLNRISWRIVQNIHALSIKYCSDSIQYKPICLISTCSDQYSKSNDLIVMFIRLYISAKTHKHIQTNSHWEKSINTRPHIKMYFIFKPVPK